MLKALSIAIILSASSASAGEIVWRSPTSGTLTAISNPVPPPTEPEQPALNVHYEPIRVAAGTVVNAVPIGDTSGYMFDARSPLPPALTLDSKTGKIAGIAAVAGNHSITVRAAKDGFYADLVLSLTIS